ncbi:MAG: hypothetical protein JNJ57_20345 [Saprospiraceae bacterium]|nr:hypothetical protein [Saprospiraceae bacterium]
MEIIDQLACSLGINTETPNIELAVRIAEHGQSSDVDELVSLLRHKDKAISSDVIKVLYELGMRKPEMIAPHTQVFIDLLAHKNNRLIWGAMTALDAISGANPEQIQVHLAKIIEAADKGSVITKDHAVGILVQLTNHPPYYSDAMALLLDLISPAAPNQFPTYCERAFQAAKPTDKQVLKTIILARLAEFDAGAKRTRLEKLLKKL